jgi:hypothetical protein
MQSRPEETITLDQWLDELQRDLKHYLQMKFIESSNIKNHSVEFVKTLFAEKNELDAVLAQQENFNDIMASSPNSQAAFLATYNLINTIKSLSKIKILCSMADFTDYTDHAIRTGQGCNNPVWDLATISNALHSVKSSTTLPIILRHHSFVLARATTVFAITSRSQCIARLTVWRR